MTDELIWWFFVLTIIVASVAFGVAVGFGLGRKSMIDEIYDRRRKGVVRRAVRRLRNAELPFHRSPKVQELEVVQ